jgi:hypothetical protein
VVEGQVITVFLGAGRDLFSSTVASPFGLREELSQPILSLPAIVCWAWAARTSNTAVLARRRYRLDGLGRVDSDRRG